MKLNYCVYIDKSNEEKSENDGVDENSKYHMIETLLAINCNNHSAIKLPLN